MIRSSAIDQTTAPFADLLPWGDPYIFSLVTQFGLGVGEVAAPAIRRRSGAFQDLAGSLTSGAASILNASNAAVFVNPVHG